MSNVKLSVPDWAFLSSDMDPAAFYRNLKALGVAAAEMTEPKNWTAVRSAGLLILNQIGPGMQQGLNNPKNHETLLPQLRDAIKTCAQNRIPHLIVFSGDRLDQPERTSIENIVMGLEQVAPDAEKDGVVLVFELFNTNDHPTYDAVHTAYGLEVVRRVGSRAVKLLYDIYHMVRMGEDPLKDILENLDAMAHLHVAESPTRTKPVRGGNIDYGTLVSRVQAAGYTGYWGLEFFPGKGGNDLDKAVALFKSFL